MADDNRTIRLVVYAGAEALASVTLDPVHAIGLGAELIAAGHSRLARTLPDIVT